MAWQAGHDDIEQEFWNVVEQGEEPVEVLYGADIDTSKTGSGFPVRSAKQSLPEPDLAAEYAESPWNLNNLPRLDGSLLKHLGDPIAGVTLPWMYMGMMFSSFCWHIEDHMFYSSKLQSLLIVPLYFPSAMGTSSALTAKALAIFEAVTQGPLMLKTLLQ